MPFKAQQTARDLSPLSSLLWVPTSLYSQFHPTFLWLYPFHVFHMDTPSTCFSYGKRCKSTISIQCSPFWLSWRWLLEIIEYRYTFQGFLLPHQCSIIQYTNFTIITNNFVTIYIFSRLKWLHMQAHTGVYGWGHSSHLKHTRTVILPQSFHRIHQHYSHRILNRNTVLKWVVKISMTCRA